jgi:hypothetical protein
VAGEWHAAAPLAVERPRRQPPRRRKPEASEVPEVADPGAVDPGVEHERDFVIALVQAAMRMAEAECAAAGFAQNWAVFASRAAGAPTASSPW